ncbi:ROK family protein [Natronosporangium hydrolyticum]|uniref:ROK family protein n=1 Tax=Natronosporangium hydrolyticum TaxID=2811111 RepID=A0A895YRA0_9ACTN|nr:ROK family protein [Natronosporangium hydrolyticum]QSB16640.1 ROK family protein [Natronosporangium hydrolyticum]
MTAGVTVLGIDIGGIGIKVCLLDADGSVVAHDRIPTPPGGEAMVEAAAALGETLAADQQRRIHAAGAGVAGVVEDGVVTAASSSFTDWTGYPVRAALETRLGVPAVVMNDVNAFLVGEATLGAVRAERDVLGVTLGTGVGGAVWLDGALYLGRSGAAGEIGHMPGFGSEPCTCGQAGHLETLASGRGVARRYLAGGGAPLTDGAAEVAARARTGDELAGRVFREAGAGVARAALMVAAVVDVVDVVIGGGLAQSPDLLRPAIEAAVAAEPPVSGRPVRIHFAALGSLAAAVGAASQAAIPIQSGA